MSDSRDHPALAHIEKLLADNYRKEIDQEENIWRSLPFFAATLALQLAALFQVIERLPSGISWPAITTHIFVFMSFGASLVALINLAASISFAKFRYVAADTDLLDYTLGLIEDENRDDNRTGANPMVALNELRSALATEYALATDNNRQINKRRESRRSTAGLLTLFSVFSTLMLVSFIFMTHVPPPDDKGFTNVSSSARPEQSTPVQAQPGNASSQPSPPKSSANAGSH